MKNEYQENTVNLSMDSQISKKDFNRKRKIALLITLGILLIVTLYSYFNVKNDFSLAANKDSVTLTAPSGTSSIKVFYKDIQSIEIVEDFEPGTCISGEETSKYAYGTWKNDLLGEYTLMITKEITHCVIVKTMSQTIVFNYEKNKTTDDLADYFNNLTNVN
jgi:hypothetical protein